MNQTQGSVVAKVWPLHLTGNLLLSRGIDCSFGSIKEWSAPRRQVPSCLSVHWGNLVLILPLFLSHSWSWMKLLERTSSKFSSSYEILWFTSLTNCKTIHSLVLISLRLCGSGSWLHTYIHISKITSLCLNHVMINRKKDKLVSY